MIDYDDWHAHVHGVLPYDRCLARDERLRAIVKARSGRAPSAIVMRNRRCFVTSRTRQEARVMFENQRCGNLLAAP